MERYHEKVGFKQEDISLLEDFTNRLNSISWKYTSHSIDNIKYRAVDMEAILRFIKDVELKPEQIFEYYSSTAGIIKVCYRINYGLTDIILVLGEDKQIITIYLNSTSDKHDNLRKELYNG